MEFNGKELSQKIQAELRRKIHDQNRELGLAAVVIGGDPALKKFVAIKKKYAQEIGITFSSYELEEDVSPQEIEDTMHWLAHDDEIQGMLVELPIPKRFDVQKIIDMIPPGKDIDVLTSKREHAFYQNDFSLLPPAVAALQTLLTVEKIDPKGKKIVVFGQGRLVGKPISHWLTEQGATVFPIDKETSDPKQYSLQADIIISGVGKPGLITADMIRDDAVVIDFGYGRKGKELVGDVDFKNVAKKASLITPVPGGMGPLVIAAVIENLLKLAV